MVSCFSDIPDRPGTVSLTLNDRGNSIVSRRLPDSTCPRPELGVWAKSSCDDPDDQAYALIREFADASSTPMFEFIYTAIREAGSLGIDACELSKTIGWTEGSLYDVLATLCQISHPEKRIAIVNRVGFARVKFVSHHFLSEWVVQSFSTSELSLEHQQRKSAIPYLWYNINGDFVVCNFVIMLSHTFFIGINVQDVLRGCDISHSALPWNIYGNRLVT